MLAAAAGDAANDTATSAAATHDTNATPNRPDTRDRAPATQADDRMAFPRAFLDVTSVAAHSAPARAACQHKVGVKPCGPRSALVSRAQRSAAGTALSPSC